jgi:hypothetical protein
VVSSTANHYGRPGGHSVCNQYQALREVADLLGKETKD